jgi:hypothetical protein
MRGILLSASGMLATASATGILAPLYVYPSIEWNDGAVNWQPVIAAARDHPSVAWLAVVNPDSGPGGAGLPGNNDVNYISGTSQLNALDNVAPIGYVRTNYSQSSLDQLKSNISQWQTWSTYAAADIAIHGLFFDESSNNFTYLSEAIDYARGVFTTPITIICNFGVIAPDEFYDICDVVVAFESCLNCNPDPPNPPPPAYLGQQTLDANFPVARRAQGAVLVNRFRGTTVDGRVADAALVDEYVKTIQSNGIGWLYFVSSPSGDYDTFTEEPATVGQLAASLDS